ncbi:hypothetical protein N7520_000618 [Penicillium odoratum]|uniref:uncharacterized protein n=1 Tax=Penicillium odoratum TaxID=1167516 RepID=UPI002547720D|nr:uncharacterized protein N7520_000618 [Penicillium odoratum]KAJ5777372.1 hypothetical protein N7520_000618 [Penicillium odoratum]
MVIFGPSDEPWPSYYISSTDQPGGDATPKTGTREASVDTSDHLDSFDEVLKNPVAIKDRAVTELVTTMDRDTPGPTGLPSSSECKKKSRFEMKKSK